MEIKRKLKAVLKTDRRFIIRHSENIEQIECPKCDSKMLVVEKVAALFDIKQIEIFQFIENDSVHFLETETKSVNICLKTLARILDARGKRSPPRLGQKF